MSRVPNQWMARWLLGCTAVFAIVYSLYLVEARGAFSPPGEKPGLVAIALLIFETAVEIGACFYALLFLISAVVYFLLKNKDPKPVRVSDCPPVGILYLCCDDLDREALSSLVRLNYRGQVHLVVHDDSSSPQAREEVDAAVEYLRRQGHSNITILRRPSKDGGKPAAVNYVVERTGHLYDFLLLCDNDSVAEDPDLIERALPYFRDRRVAVVQCRNVAADSPAYSAVNRLLSKSIDVSHVFLTICARFGWSLFVGHNAFIRMSALREVGAFTPGFFADDLDFAVRLNLKGHRVQYAAELRFGEKHPPSYDAFRRRAYKWSYGCMQMLKAHSRSVLRSPRMSLAEKLSFFSFAGFYIGQTLLLAYLGVHFLLAPFYLNSQPVSLAMNFIVGGCVVLVIYLPTLSYFAKQRSLTRSLGSVVMCGLVYGSTDFVCAQAVKDCVLGRKRRWVPTNAVSQSSGNRGLFAEAIFGLSLLCAPLVAFPAMLYQPCAYLFLGKFLFGPAIALLYRDQDVPMAAPSRPRRLSTAASLLVLIASLTMFSAPARAEAGRTRVEIHGKEIRVDGRPFVVKGVHYGPWRPGTGPGKQYPYPEAAAVEGDMRMISSLNANTILVVDPPGYVLDAADRYGIKVLYAFFVQWWTIGSPEGAAGKDNIVRRVREYSSKPALLGWVLGNEVPTQVIETRGAQTIESGLRELYGSVKASDPAHPVMHSNWPLAKDLHLEFFDVAGFNVYPVWPPEVPAMGFGNYIRRVLQPIASEKPLLVTEFGANTLEAGEDGQVTLLKKCWEELLKAGASGGIVFEFADEWWKNYDNPKNSNFAWDRKNAPDDEKVHDQDPEEYYGIADGYRKPRPAFAAVRDMFRESPQRASVDGRTVPEIMVTALTLLAFGSWLWARRARRVAAAQADAERQDGPYAREHRT